MWVIFLIVGMLITFSIIAYILYNFIREDFSIFYEKNGEVFEDETHNQKIGVLHENEGKVFVNLGENSYETAKFQKIETREGHAYIIQ